MADLFENALATLLPNLETIPDEKLKKLDMPPEAVAQDALYTYKWCQADRAALTARNLDWRLVEAIPIRVMAFEEAQSNWNNVRFSREEAMKVWMAASPVGYALRDEILHEYRYGYRRHPALHARIDAVAEGQGDADMIQDLNDLVVIGRKNPDPLTAIAFDFNLLDEAAKQCKTLGHLRAEASVDRAAYREQKLVRDQAYTYLKEAVDEVRECGRFVFWRNEERRSGYVSQYKKRQRKRTSNETESEVTEALSESIEIDTPKSDTKSA